MQSSGKPVPNYLDVFEQRLQAQKIRLKQLLDTPKQNRDKHKIKHILRETQKLKRILKQYKSTGCPNCGYQPPHPH